MNGVFNGCRKVEKVETEEKEALDCVHEMDTINHYVGMYPIAAGGVVERAFSPFITSLLGTMLVGFLFTDAKRRTAALAIGFAAITVWMSMTYYGEEGIRYQNIGYLKALVTALDQDTSEDDASDIDPAAAALIARLKASLGEMEEEKPEESGLSEKERLIKYLRDTFVADQERRPEGERQEWNGSNAQVLKWHYEKSLGRYFNVPEEIIPMVKKMSLAADLTFWALLVAMAIVVIGARRTGGLVYWLLVIPSILLPVFFVVDYSAWLWWYGHSLNAMGAFTVKPFMPTVFGDGKVAQFTTHSYPYIGFGLMLLSSALLAVAALMRRKQLREST
ncbi:MAG TPA: hypothetical protein ENK54_08830 [Thiotrichales bacterium]|nr:hypothetical protein [Thiotrichales bacterium]